MHRLHSLWEYFISEENIRQAILNAARHKRKKRAVRRVLADIDRYVREIRAMLMDDTFRVGRYRVMEVMTQGKVRRIEKLPFFPDRIIQHMLANVLLKRWNESLTGDTYASWKGRGINCSTRRFNLNARLRAALCSYPRCASIHCLQLDIRKCYQTTDNDRLWRVVCRFCRDWRVLRILKRFIYSIGYLPIGSYLSQLLINIYLSRLDRYVKETLKVKHYFRYMDDIVILCDDKARLQEWKHRIGNFLFYDMGYELNRKCQVYPVGTGRRRGRGIDYVGYVFFRDFTLLRKRIKQAFQRSVRTGRGDSSLISYIGLVQPCNGRHLIARVTGMKLGRLKFHKVRRAFDGERVSISDLVGVTIDIVDFEIKDSKRHDGTMFVKLQVRMPNGTLRFVCGGYRYIIAFLEQLDAKRVCPLEDVVIAHDKLGYYIQGTLEPTASSLEDDDDEEDG